MKQNNKLISNKHLTLISGPCAIESEIMALDTAEFLKELTNKLGINFIYKSSFDKANRSSVSSKRGVGINEGLKILDKVKTELDLNILTDVHEYTPFDEVADVVDVLQTPAFLCRQTDFILKVSATHKPINIKKGQFTSPQEMLHVLEKAYSTGNKEIYLCERGYMFGYNNLVSDMRSLVIMKEMGCPVVYDASHSVQKPGAKMGASSGDSKYILPLAKAATAIGIDALFIESHPDPSKAISDGDNSMKLDNMENLLKEIISIDNTVRKGE
ncbi:MAG: 3-deoxy-8-phosphooctulonate synthase [Gammaproteobacteria bacterium]|nr:3-deoxy-8-phosphooctulonate synthase [Gammaproteobacteria bacterium]MBL6819030.1 3-deoxy-8-phosphooctulonate synthase [Gammaproteobacteria bacterium]MBL6899134.1 3-deoxy-8-phosphooctulonate synthase [Gammaproteobacteria bacterium]